MYILVRDQYDNITVSYVILLLCYLLIPLQNAPPGAVLVGSITYGTVSTFNKKDDQHAPVSYNISYTIPPSKVTPN
jgi:hypothetical protein